MFRKRVIVAAIGEKDVQYGNGHPMPRIFLELVSTSKADSWTLSRGGAVASFVATRRSIKLLEHFFLRAEILREILPSVRIGVAQGSLPAQFDWFGLKRDYRIDLQAEDCALANVQGPQSYRDELEKFQRGR